jgi:hypothetical protein
MELAVMDNDREPAQRVYAPMLEALQTALVELHRLQRLPDHYADVTQGRFASLKRWIKRKLLGNFQRAYVDVLSRQQSAFNQETLTALSELAECLAMLQSAEMSPTALEERVERLEQERARDMAFNVEKA